MSENSFTKMDRLKAQEAFSLWKAKEDCDIDEYILRERKEELHRLVKKVIKNELCEKDRRIVVLHWYEGKTKEEIAEIVGSDRSTIFRRIEKINEIIYEKLKYAIEYRYGDDFSNKAMLLIKKDISSKQELNRLESIGDRLLKLRSEQYLSKQDVASLTGINVERISRIEKSGREITMSELKKLSAFFHVTSDYILFGKDRIIRDGKTGRPVLVAI